MTPVGEEETKAGQTNLPKELTPGKPEGSQLSSNKSTPNEKKVATLTQPFGIGAKPMPNHALSLKKHPQGCKTV